jgi:hypothetical protein
MGIASKAITVLALASSLLPAFGASAATPPDPDIVTPEMSITVANTGTLGGLSVAPDELVVTVHGTYSCSSPAVIFFNIEATERPIGSRLGSLSENFLSCPAENRPWEATITTFSSSKPWHPGAVNVEYDAHFTPLPLGTGATVDVAQSKTVILRPAD